MMLLIWNSKKYETCFNRTINDFLWPEIEEEGGYKVAGSTAEKLGEKILGWGHSSQMSDISLLWWW